MELVDILGLVSSVFILCLFLTGLPLCAHLRKTRSIKNVSSVPFFAGLLNCCLWLHYGLMVTNPMLYVIQIIGIFLNGFYLGCYYVFCPNVKTMYAQMITLIISVVSVLVYTLMAPFEKGVWAACLIASIASLFFVAAPLAELKTVVKTKSTKSISFPMTFCNLLLAVLFSWYGYLLKDNLLLYFNCVGCALSLFTMSFFVIYPNSKPTNKKLK